MQDRESHRQLTTWVMSVRTGRQPKGRYIAAIWSIVESSRLRQRVHLDMGPMRRDHLHCPFAVNHFAGYRSLKECLIFLV